MNGSQCGREQQPTKITQVESLEDVQLIALEAKLKAVVKRVLGRCGSPDKVYGISRDLLTAGMNLYRAAIDPADRKRVEMELMKTAKRSAGKFKKRFQRAIVNHVSTSTPVGNWELTEAKTTIEVMLRAQEIPVLQYLLADEIVRDAKLILRQRFAEGKLRGWEALQQMEDVVELMLREGIKLPAALREVQEAQGVRVSPATAHSQWKAVQRSLQLRHGYLRPEGTHRRLVQRKKKPPMRDIAAERELKQSPASRKGPGKAVPGSKKQDAAG